MNSRWPDGQHDRVVAAARRPLDEADAVLLLGLLRAHPRVPDVDPRAVPGELRDEVGDLRVPEVRRVLLEREAHHEDARGLHVDALRGHQAHDLARDVQRHVVVDAPAREDHLRVVADLLRLVRQVIRVDADAVAADEARPERQEIPLAARRLEHLLSVDAEPVEDHGELVDERDVDVALRVLDHLGGLCDADRRRAMGAGLDDRAVQLVDEVGRLRRRAGGDLADRRQPVLAVARVDALRAVAREEVAVELEAGAPLEDRHADLLGAAGEYRRLVNDDVAALQDVPDRLARPLERPEVRPLVGVDRRRHGHDVDAAGLQVLGLGREPQPLGGAQLARRPPRACGPCRDAARPRAPG